MHHKAHTVVISFIVCSVLAITLAGCSDKISLSSLGPVTLTWDEPTTYTDNTTLAPTDIKGHMIYYATSPGEYNNIDSIFVPAPATSATVSNIFNQGPGTYYFVVTTVDKTDIESDFSNEMRREVY